MHRGELQDIHRSYNWGHEPNSIMLHAGCQVEVQVEAT
jgi:hypothetical protein